MQPILLMQQWFVRCHASLQTPDILWQAMILSVQPKLDTDAEGLRALDAWHL